MPPRKRTFKYCTTQKKIIELMNPSDVIQRNTTHNSQMHIPGEQHYIDEHLGPIGGRGDKKKKMKEQGFSYAPNADSYDSHDFAREHPRYIEVTERSKQDLGAPFAHMDELRVRKT